MLEVTALSNWVFAKATAVLTLPAAVTIAPKAVSIDASTWVADSPSWVTAASTWVFNSLQIAWVSSNSELIAVNAVVIS